MIEPRRLTFILPYTACLGIDALTHDDARSHVLMG